MKSDLVTLWSVDREKAGGGYNESVGTATGRKLIPPGVVPMLVGGIFLSHWHTGHCGPSLWL